MKTTKKKATVLSPAQILCKHLKVLGTKVHELPELHLQGKDGAALTEMVMNLDDLAKSDLHVVNKKTFEKLCTKASKRLSTET